MAVAEDGVLDCRGDVHDGGVAGLVGYDGADGVVEVRVRGHVGEAEEEDAGALEVRTGRVGHAPGVLVDFGEENGVMVGGGGGGGIWAGEGWSAGCAVSSLSGRGDRGAGSQERHGFGSGFLPGLDG